MDGKYHREIGFPQVELPSGTIYLQYTGHAARDAVIDRYGNIPLLNRVSIKPEDIFEIVVRAGKVVKYAVRLNFNADLDIVLVIADGFRVVTQWFNRTDDNHKTLRREEYAVPA
jgi:hypothetical protein